MFRRTCRCIWIFRDLRRGHVFRDVRHRGDGSRCRRSGWRHSGISFRSICSSSDGKASYLAGLKVVFQRVRHEICICRPADTSRAIQSASLLDVAQRKSGEHRRSLNQLGGRIRELREEFGISQAELCRRLQRAGWDCDTLVMSRIERGVRTLTDIEILAIFRVLKKSLKDF